MRRTRTPARAAGAMGAAQLRLPLAPACEWHAKRPAAERTHGDAQPCARDAQVCVTDPVRGQRAVCCAPHALALVALWRASVPNRRRNCTRVALAWLPDASRRVALPRVPGRGPTPALPRAALPRSTDALTAWR